MKYRNILLGFLAFLIVFGTPVLFGYQQRLKFRNLRTVEPGLIYRSGKLNAVGFQKSCNDYQFKCVVTFRLYREGDPNPDIEEEEYCKQHGIRYEKIVPRKWHSENGTTCPADVSVAQFLKLMDARKEIGPILLHCLAGKHRTGAFVAIYRMEYQGWTNAEAIEEMREFGYDNIDTEGDVRGYLERYRPRSSR